MKFKFKIKVPFMEFSVDSIADVEVNEKGVPKDRFWRNRVRDSQVDGCIELFKEDVPVVKNKSKQEIIANADITT